MKKISVLAVTGLLVVIAGCGGGDDSDGSPPAVQTQQREQAPTNQETTARKASGTTITVRDSEFGSMLFDAKKQAIYIFENDRKDKSVCYDECAEAWPPVFTKGDPKAGEGVKASLLGTVKRRDGKLQVTYDGKPLYFYANEGPGEVRCHNVNLNGGFWWVVGPDGERRP
jgi:predicted lipoprotein with Yx(FWY)xxD motif